MVMFPWRRHRQLLPSSFHDMDGWRRGRGGPTGGLSDQFYLEKYCSLQKPADLDILCVCIAPLMPDHLFGAGTNGLAHVKRISPAVYMRIFALLSTQLKRRRFILANQPEICWLIIIFSLHTLLLCTGVPWFARLQEILHYFTRPSPDLHETFTRPSRDLHLTFIYV